MTAESIRVSREELYEKVWSEPLATLGPKLGLSDVGLAKACKRMRAPVPWRGYWAKKQAGHKVKPTPLPRIAPTASKDTLKVTIRPRATNDTGEVIDTGPVADQQRFESRLENAIVVAEQLADPHSLVALTVKALRRAKSDHAGFLAPQSRADSGSQSLDRLGGSCDVHHGRSHQSVRASCMARQHWEFASAPDRGANRRGGRAHSPRGANEAHRASSGSESAAARPIRPFVAAVCQLALRIDESWLGIRTTWADGARQRVETSLNSFMIGLIAASEKIRENRLAREERQRQWEAEERRRQEEEHRRLEHRARVRALNQAIELQRQGDLVRDYVRRVRRVPNATELLAANPALVDWLAWAERYANAIDPLLPAPGRGWHGIRRLGTDLAEGAQHDERVLNGITGHRNSATRQQI